MRWIKVDFIYHREKHNTLFADIIKIKCRLYPHSRDIKGHHWYEWYTPSKLYECDPLLWFVSLMRQFLRKFANFLLFFKIFQRQFAELYKCLFKRDTTKFLMGCFFWLTLELIKYICRHRMQIYFINSESQKNHKEFRQFNLISRQFAKSCRILFLLFFLCKEIFFPTLIINRSEISKFVSFYWLV